MALTPTKKIALGFTAPDFELPDAATGATIGLRQLRGKVATVVMFICNHCPYVKHVQHGLVQLASDYIPKGVTFVAINSNDAANYPEDAPDKMKEEIRKVGYPFPYLFDESQEVAKAYEAACTPDFNIFDKDLKCVYRGQMDDSRPGNGIAVSGRDIRKALDQLIAGGEVDTDQQPSVGCNIKWKE